MKAEDLRKGNLVKHHDWPMALTVVGIRENNTVVLEGTGVGYLHTPYFEPIPLTEEWLLKGGFKKKGDKFYCEDGCIFVTKADNSTKSYWLYLGYDSESGSEWKCINDIEFLHQLQNLYFALTNQELSFRVAVETN